jgi:hypothetical protein
LDVHTAKTVACVVDAESGEMTVYRLPGETAAVVAFCVGLLGPTRVAYEAGPTGFALARELGAAGVVSSRRRGRSSVRHRTESRPTSVTLSGWCGY